MIASGFRPQLEKTNGTLEFNLASALAALSGADCHAQWYGGWGGYTEAATPYSAGVRSQAEMTMAVGAAAESFGKAAISREEARSAYIDNEVKFINLRRENRDVKDAREAKKKQEQKERAALRPRPGLSPHFIQGCHRIR